MSTWHVSSNRNEMFSHFRPITVHCSHTFPSKSNWQQKRIVSHFLFSRLLKKCWIFVYDFSRDACYCLFKWRHKEKDRHHGLTKTIDKLNATKTYADLTWRRVLFTWISKCVIKADTCVFNIIVFKILNEFIINCPKVRL